MVEDVLVNLVHDPFRIMRARGSASLAWLRRSRPSTTSAIFSGKHTIQQPGNHAHTYLTVFHGSISEASDLHAAYTSRNTRPATR